MINSKQLLTLLFISLLVFTGIAATRQARPKNLQVLPKDISAEKLDSIMHSYNKALKVDCSFCHVKTNLFPDTMDYVSDANHMKNDARKMIRLTIQINKDYFYYDTLQRPEYLKVVSCNTCHRGDPFPADQ